MTRAELAKELRKWSIWAAEHYADLCCLDGQRLELRSALEHTAALLDDDTTERDARRYQVIKSMYGDEPRWFRIDSNQGRIMGIRSTGMENRPENENRWYPSLDAAIDAWMEGEG